MPTLYHHPLCPHSRFARLALAEHGIEPQLVEERAWERRRAFLELDPAGATPLLVDGALAVPGAAGIMDHLDETRGEALGAHRLMPQGVAVRVETRRLADWFNGKFFAEVSCHLVTEKVYRRFMAAGQGGGAPDMEAVRAARGNLRHHLRYIGHLVARRNWLAGDRLSFADLAGAAQLSSIDFLGDVPWDEDEGARHWYAKIKSRPSFRALLADRIAGMQPGPVYADLDF